MHSPAPQRAVTIPIQRANAFITRHHRHHPPPAGAQLAVGILRGPRLVGVAILGRPVPPAVDDGATIEVTRTGTDHTSDYTGVEIALYRAAWHVARVYGYSRLLTHTHLGEITRALRAVGLRPMATVPPRAGTHIPIGTTHGRGVDGVCRTRWDAAGVRSGTASTPPTIAAASDQRPTTTVCADQDSRQPCPQEDTAQAAATGRWAA